MPSRANTAKYQEMREVPEDTVEAKPRKMDAAATDQCAMIQPEGQGNALTGADRRGAHHLEVSSGLLEMESEKQEEVFVSFGCDDFPELHRARSELESQRSVVKQFVLGLMQELEALIAQNCSPGGEPGKVAGEQNDLTSLDGIIPPHHCSSLQEREADNRQLEADVQHYTRISQILKGLLAESKLRIEDRSVYLATDHQAQQAELGPSAQGVIRGGLGARDEPPSLPSNPLFRNASLLRNKSVRVIESGWAERLDSEMAVQAGIMRLFPAALPPQSKMLSSCVGDECPSWATVFDPALLHVAISFDSSQEAGGRERDMPEVRVRDDGVLELVEEEAPRRVHTGRHQFRLPTPKMTVSWSMTIKCSYGAPSADACPFHWKLERSLADLIKMHMRLTKLPKLPFSQHKPLPSGVPPLPAFPFRALNLRPAGEEPALVGYLDQLARNQAVEAGVAFHTFFEVSCATFLPELGARICEGLLTKGRGALYRACMAALCRSSVAEEGGEELFQAGGAKLTSWYVLLDSSIIALAAPGTWRVKDVMLLGGGSSVRREKGHAGGSTFVVTSGPRSLRLRASSKADRRRCVPCLSASALGFRVQGLGSEGLGFKG